MGAADGAADGRSSLFISVSEVVEKFGNGSRWATDQDGQRIKGLRYFIFK